MKFSDRYSTQVASLLANAKKELADDMTKRGIGAIIWDNATANFHYVPEVVCRCADKGKKSVVRIEGIYLYNGGLYLINEDKARLSVKDFYNKDSEVQPTVVTLTPKKSEKDLGNPGEQPEVYITQGSLEEWLVMADCYFEALAEE